LSFPRCSANFFFDLLVLGFAELSAAIVDTPEMLDLTVVDKIESMLLFIKNWATEICLFLAKEYNQGNFC
jgi:hypothetical protein